jgi:hypothetical protein
LAGNIDIRATIEGWREQLLDLSKRNRLVNCHIGRRGALELEHPEFGQIWQTVVVEGARGVFAYKSNLLQLTAEEGAYVF